MRWSYVRWLVGLVVLAVLASALGQLRLPVNTIGPPQPMQADLLLLAPNVPVGTAITKSVIQNAFYGGTNNMRVGMLAQAGPPVMSVVAAPPILHGRKWPRLMQLSNVLYDGGITNCIKYDEVVSTNQNEVDCGFEDSNTVVHVVTNFAIVHWFGVNVPATNNSLLKRDFSIVYPGTNQATNFEASQLNVNSANYGITFEISIPSPARYGFQFNIPNTNTAYLIQELYLTSQMFQMTVWDENLNQVAYSSVPFAMVPGVWGVLKFGFGNDNGANRNLPGGATYFGPMAFFTNNVTSNFNVITGSR